MLTSNLTQRSFSVQTLLVITLIIIILLLLLLLLHPFLLVLLLLLTNMYSSTPVSKLHSLSLFVSHGTTTFVQMTRHQEEILAVTKMTSVAIATVH